MFALDVLTHCPQQMAPASSQLIRI